MTGAHAAAVLAIYQAGIEEGNATFETRAPDWAAFPPPPRRPARRSGRPPGGMRPRRQDRIPPGPDRIIRLWPALPRLQPVAARRGARRSTRWVSSASAVSKLAGSPAGTGSGMDQCTAVASASSS